MVVACSSAGEGVFAPAVDIPACVFWQAPAACNACNNPFPRAEPVAVDRMISEGLRDRLFAYITSDACMVHLQSHCLAYVHLPARRTLPRLQARHCIRVQVRVAATQRARQPCERPAHRRRLEGTPNAGGRHVTELRQKAQRVRTETPAHLHCDGNEVEAASRVADRCELHPFPRSRDPRRISVGLARTRRI